VNLNSSPGVEPRGRGKLYPSEKVSSTVSLSRAAIISLTINGSSFLARVSPHSKKLKVKSCSEI
jgi:hypothetical protein